MREDVRELELTVQALRDTLSAELTADPIRRARAVHELPALLDIVVNVIGNLAGEKEELERRLNRLESQFRNQ